MSDCKGKNAVIFFVTLLILTSVSQLTAKNLLVQVRDKLAKSAPFSLSFKQQVYDDTEKIAEESGQIFYANIRQVKWEYTDPEHKIFLIEKERFRFYDVENNQVTQGKIQKNRQKWIWQILVEASPGDEVSFDASQRKIFIKNRPDDIDLSVTIGPKGFPRKVIQLQGAGVKYVYHFSAYQSKREFSPDMFILSLPKDIEIVEME